MQPEAASRKAHRKSRLGCQNCKRRRIKCDEVHPACSNCMKHNINCDFSSFRTHATQSQSLRPAPVPSPLSSKDAERSPRPQSSRDESTNASTPTTLPVEISQSAQALKYDPPPFTPITLPLSDNFGMQAINPTDIHLWHHFMTHTILTFNPGAPPSAFWTSYLPSLGFQNPYILQLILSLSAMHLSRLSPSQSSAYISLAQQHHSSALVTFSSELSTLNPSTAQALYAGAILVCRNMLAFGPQPGEYIAFGSSGEAQWISLIRGIRAITDLSKGINHFHVSNLEKDTYISFNDRFTLRNITPPDWRTPLRNLREYIVEHHSNNQEAQEEKKANLGALDVLWETYKGAWEGLPPQDSMANMSYSSIIFAWLYRIEQDFADCLKSHRPWALVVFSYWVVLLRQIDESWFIEGWVDHCLQGVENFLPEGYLSWLEWPVGFARSLAV